MFIYSILNTVNGKRYIGRATDPKRRWKRHRRELKYKYHHNEHLQRAWDKYGETAFSFEILETCLTKEQTWERERFWIKHYKSTHPEIGYNKDKGGKGPDLGPEALVKISKANKGRPLSEQHCQRISEANKGRIISKESSRKTGETLRRRYAEGSLTPTLPPIKYGKDHHMWGKTHTPEARAKISAAQIGRSYEERMGEEVAKQVKAKKRLTNKGSGNPFYKHFDIEYVKSQIDKGSIVKEISAEINVSLPTIYHRFKDTYGCTITEYKARTKDRDGRNSDIGHS